LEKSLLIGLIIPGVDIENLANFSKNLANLVDLTLEKQKICIKLPIFQWKQEKKSVKFKHCLLLSGNPLTFG